MKNITVTRVYGKFAKLTVAKNDVRIKLPYSFNSTESDTTVAWLSKVANDLFFTDALPTMRGTVIDSKILMRGSIGGDEHQKFSKMFTYNPHTMKTQSDIALILGSKNIYVEPTAKDKAVNETAKRIALNSTYGILKSLNRPIDKYTPIEKSGLNSIHTKPLLEMNNEELEELQRKDHEANKLNAQSIGRMNRIEPLKPTNDIKGEYMGICNLSSCKTGDAATWYNYGSLSYYCPKCANRLNSDPFNQRDAMRLFGHDLCLEGPEKTK